MGCYDRERQSRRDSVWAGNDIAGPRPLVGRDQLPAILAGGIAVETQDGFPIGLAVVKLVLDGLLAPGCPIPYIGQDDTLRAGVGLCDRGRVERMVSEGPARIQELLDWGVEFSREAGELAPPSNPDDPVAEEKDSG